MVSAASVAGASLAVARAVTDAIVVCKRLILIEASSTALPFGML